MSIFLLFLVVAWIVLPRVAPLCEVIAVARGLSRVHARLLHPAKHLKEIVVALCHRLCLLPVGAPHVHAVPAHQHGARLRVRLHRGLHAVTQIPLLGRVLDDGHNELVVVLVPAAVRATNALDHLLVSDAKVLAAEQRRHHRMLRVRVDARARGTEIIGEEEEGGALALLQVQARRRQRNVLAGGRAHKHLDGEHALLLNARGRHVDLVAVWLKYTLEEAPKEHNSAYPWRIVMPPPVPVTQPRW